VSFVKIRDANVVAPDVIADVTDYQLTRDHKENIDANRATKNVSKEGLAKHDEHDSAQAINIGVVSLMC
jgi:hypothetical protein